MEHTNAGFSNGRKTPDGKPFKTAWVFGSLWVLMFVLYFPAAKAGFVTDFTGWLDQVKNHSFNEYINRTNFQAHSLYQFTQLLTYFFYHIFGIHPWLWHLLFITMHVTNACLVFLLCSRLLTDAGVANGRNISFWGALFFCVSPYISEVVVWEPAFHFWLGLMLILVILVCTQQFIYTGNRKYAWQACIIYLLSLFSLEVFCVTPWLVMALGLFYKCQQGYDKRASIRIFSWFFIPMLLLFAGRMLLFKLIYGSWVSRIGTNAVTTLQHESLGKPLKYLFHLLLLGRFFSYDDRNKVYAFCDSWKGIVLFYGFVTITVIWIVAKFRIMKGKGKVSSLLFIWLLITLILLIPLWFSDILLVIFDRYAYLPAAFFYMLLAVLAACISQQYIRLGVLILFALANLRFAIQVSRYWGKSYRIINGLLANLPDAGDKVVLLLNLPESMNGVPMIGAEKQSEYKLMHNLLLPAKQITNDVYDVLAYNMLTPDDGAHATVINDSTVRVTMNQWGTWWWYEGKGAYTYENGYYKENLVDGGHFYDLILKQPSGKYLLLYQVGNQWKIVDMSKKNTEQD